MIFIFGEYQRKVNLCLHDHIENLLRSDQKRLRERILKISTLKTPIHIALVRFEFRSHCTIFTVAFLSCDL